MAPCIVYRVENRVGGGPFHDTRDRYSMFDLNAHDMPSPFADGIIDYGCMHFGFQSYELLRKWFSLDSLKLANFGFRVVAYMVAPGCVKFGSEQVAFNRAFSIKVRAFSLRRLARDS